MLGASLSFTVMVTLVKLVREDLTAFEIIAWRTVVSLPLAWSVARSAGLVVTDVRTLVARCLLGFSAMVCFFTAAKGLPVTDLALVSKLQPVAIAVIAPLLLGAGERPGPRVFATLVLGMLGCAVLLGPDLGVGPVPQEVRLSFGLVAVAGALFSATAHTMVRKLGATEHPTTVVFWFQAAVLPLSLIGVVVSGVTPTLPSLLQLAQLAGIGVFATLGQLWMTRAYQLDRAARVAAVSYAQPVFAVAIDVVAFSVWPGPNAWVGGALVVVAGLALLVHREDETPA
ncbi:MAG: drug/metabolite transporter (DMT)-like permease [Myxococcota bacterium]|jgi:drug/metabolite transporter (DMT)-like permease